MKIELISHIPNVVTHATPILFVHGAWHGAWCWEKYFMPYFADKGYPVYALSLRGHGESSGTEKLRWYRIKDYADDIKKVADQLPEVPILIGHSLGGYVVQKYLEKYQSPAAVLMASIPAGGIIKMMKRLIRKHPLLFFKVNFLMSLYPFIGTPQRTKEMLFSKSMDAVEINEYFRKLRDESYLSFLDMLFFRAKPRLVKTPVFVMGAENDNVFYRKDIRKTAEAYKVKAAILPDTAHDIMLEKNWQNAANTILEWLQSKGL